MQDTFMLYGKEANLVNFPMGLKKKQEQQDKATSSGSKEAGEVTFDDLLIAVGKSRNRDAFIRLFEHFAPRVKSFLMRGGLPQEMADELAQETMLTVWQKAVRFDPERASASTWIFTIARNKRIDHFRKSGRPEPDSEDPMLAPDLPALPDQQVSQQQYKQMLGKALTELSPDQAEMIRKAFLEEKTHADIAAETGIPLGTVKSRIRLALEKLRYHMEAQE